MCVSVSELLVYFTIFFIWRIYKFAAIELNEMNIRLNQIVLILRWSLRHLEIIKFELHKYVIYEIHTYMK